MMKKKQAVFLHENKRKQSGGFTEMSVIQKKEYRKERQKMYVSREEEEVQRLKDNGYLTKNNWQLVMGNSS
tara:strand:+ start:5885 stop:6097 length:213 start_codon:yes stop_codon:yes gene_type:complete